jgi:hypothetical protein
VGTSASHNPMGLHGLLQGELYLLPLSHQHRCGNCSANCIRNFDHNKVLCIFRVKLLTEESYINLYSIFIPRYFPHEMLWIINVIYRKWIGLLELLQIYTLVHACIWLRREEHDSVDAGNLSFPQTLLRWFLEGIKVDCYENSLRIVDCHGHFVQGSAENEECVFSRE